MRGEGMPVQVGGSVRMLGDCTSIAVCGDCTVIRPTRFRMGQVFPIISDGQDDLVDDEPASDQVEREQICHFLHHQPGL